MQTFRIQQSTMEPCSS